MEIVPVTAATEPQWEQLCASATGAWFWHGRAWRDYTIAYRPELGTTSLAFMVRDGGVVVGGVPLSLETGAQAGSGSRRLSFGGSECWAPVVSADLSARRSVQVLGEILDHVRRLATEHGAVWAGLRVSPLGARFTEHLPAFLAASTRAGWLDASMTSQMIDLTVPAETLRSEMSKGHRADVTRAGRSLTVDVSSGDLAQLEWFDDYRRMHALAAGRVTRPPMTFDLMRHWLADGRAALARCRREQTIVGYTYIILHADGAYYASAANHPDHDDLPVGHAIQAAAIAWLRERGYRRYELGLQQFGPLPHDLPDTKARGIARFKRGFGGITVPLVIRELYLDADVYAAVTAERSARYAAALAAQDG